MKIVETKFPGVLIIEPTVFNDGRGFFFESYHFNRYLGVGVENSFVQDNFSRSTKGVLRGLHYQLKHPQGKLVHVSRGEVFDVVVDIRKGSATFGEWLGIKLSDENHLQLYVPPNYAHGFYVLSDFADFCYKCTNYYHPEDEYGIIWNDSEIGIHWPIEKNAPLLSVKDKQYLSLNKTPAHNLPNYKG